MEAQKPIAKIRAGTVACALWENGINVNSTTKTVLKASIQRRYKDRDGEWRSSTSFSRNEIPLAVFCLQKAFEKIVEMQIEGSSNGAVEEEDWSMKGWLLIETLLALLLTNAIVWFVVAMGWPK